MYSDSNSCFCNSIAQFFTLIRKQNEDQNKLSSIISEAVTTANARLSSLEKVRSFVLSDEPFSVRNDCMTASGIIKRQQINKLYQERLEQLYQRKSSL